MKLAEALQERADLNRNIQDEGDPVTPSLSDGISVRGLRFAYEEEKTILSVSS